MKRLLLLLLVPALTGCLGFEKHYAQAQVEFGQAFAKQGEENLAANEKMRADIVASAAETAAGIKSQEEHIATMEAAADVRAATVGASLNQLFDSGSETWAKLKNGLKSEFATVSAGAKGIAGVLGFGPIVDLLATAATAFGATNIARNKGIIGTTRVQPRTGYPGPGDTVPPRPS